MIKNFRNLLALVMLGIFRLASPNRLLAYPYEFIDLGGK